MSNCARVAERPRWRRATHGGIAVSPEAALAIRKRHFASALVIGVLLSGCGMVRGMSELTQFAAQLQTAIGSPLQINRQIGTGPNALTITVSGEAIKKLSDAQISDYEERVALTAYRLYPRTWSISNITVVVSRVHNMGVVSVTRTGNARTWSVASLAAQAGPPPQVTDSTDSVASVPVLRSATDRDSARGSSMKRSTVHHQ